MTYHRMLVYFKKLKLLKQRLAEADAIQNPINRAAEQYSLRAQIEEVERLIDEEIRRL